MPLLDAFVTRAGASAVRDVRLVQSLLAQEEVEPEHPRIFRALGFPDEYIETFTSPYTPPWGIFGVGLWGHPGESLTAAMFLVGPPGLREPIEVGDLAHSEMTPVVERRLGYAPRGFVGVLLPAMELHGRAGPGASIHCMGNAGTLGLPVWTRSGHRAITTAGHVGSAIGAKVMQQESVVGFVDTTDHPSRNVRGQPCADLAVVSMHPSAKDDFPDGLLGVGNAGQYDELFTINEQPQHAWVRGVAETWASSRTNGSWGDVLLTDEAISTPGSSGTLCVNDAGAAVGHVVGGAVPAFSAVQDINYQLTALGITPRLQ